MANKEPNENIVKPIIIHDEEHEREYTLEFNRDTVKFAEQRGFDINDVQRFPMTKLPELFYYAFRMHHPNISRANTDKIFFDSLGGLTDQVANRLGELYAVPYEALNGADERKNPKVTVEL